MSPPFFLDKWFGGAKMIRKMDLKDLPTVLAMLKGAIQVLKKRGIPQWQNGYPNEEIIKNDFQKGQAYIFEKSGEILGYAAVFVTPDLSYQQIEGKWLTIGSYATFHRVMLAFPHPKESGTLFFRELEKLAKTMNQSAIRIDTHEKNIAMKRQLEIAGFHYCGIIELVESKEKREAFEKIIAK